MKPIYLLVVILLVTPAIVSKNSNKSKAKGVQSNTKKERSTDVLAQSTDGSYCLTEKGALDSQQLQLQVINQFLSLNKQKAEDQKRIETITAQLTQCQRPKTSILLLIIVSLCTLTGMIVCCLCCVAPKVLKLVLWVRQKLNLIQGF